MNKLKHFAQTLADFFNTILWEVPFPDSGPQEGQYLIKVYPDTMKKTLGLSTKYVYLFYVLSNGNVLICTQLSHEYSFYDENFSNLCSSNLKKLNFADFYFIDISSMMGKYRAMCFPAWNLFQAYDQLVSSGNTNMTLLHEPYLLMMHQLVEIIENIRKEIISEF